MNREQVFQDYLKSSRKNLIARYLLNLLIFSIVLSPIFSQWFDFHVPQRVVEFLTAFSSTIVYVTVALGIVTAMMIYFAYRDKSSLTAHIKRSVKSKSVAVSKSEILIDAMITFLFVVVLLMMGFYVSAFIYSLCEIFIKWTTLKKIDETKEITIELLVS